MAKVTIENVPDGIEGWQISAARVGALWGYRDLESVSGVALSAIQRIEMLSPIIVRREGMRKVEGSADEATIRSLLEAFASVGLELRPAKGQTGAAVVCVDADKLAKRRANEVKERARARA